MHRTISYLIILALLFGSLTLADTGTGVSPSGYLTSMPPEKPCLTKPLDGTINTALPVVVEWDSLIHAATYQLQVSHLSDFSQVAFSKIGIKDTTFMLDSLINGVEYYWRVYAENLAGAGEASEVWKFTTIVAKPGAPVLTTPAKDSTSVSTHPTLIWNKVPLAETYHLQVAATVDFTDLVLEQDGIKDTTFVLSNLENDTRYYWRVCAGNVAGTGEYSEIWNFTTIIALPGLPLLSSPNNGATGIPVNTILTWNTVSQAASYHLQVSTTPEFVDSALDQTGIKDTTFILTNLSNDTKYYWRISAENLAGEGEYSEVWNFTTIIAKPAAPNLSLPTDGAMDVPISAKLIWHVAASADSYLVQVSTVADFAVLTYENALAADTSCIAENLGPKIKYYWRVSATNVGGTGEYSAVWSFTTGFPTGVEGNDIPLPKSFALLPVYPNPFNSSASLIVQLPKVSEVSIIVYNSRGQMIRTLVTGMMQAGTHTVHWDGRDHNGMPVPSGVYICAFRSEDRMFMQKMLMIR